MEYTYNLKRLQSIIQTEKGKDFVKKVEKIYDDLYANKPLTVLSYAKYKLIHTTGERAPFENEYFDRRNRLCLLQILCVYDDKYLSDLEDLLSAICEEYTWILPPHNALEYNRFDYTVIDLFSAETAFYLSETAYVFKEKLGYDIKSRINARLYERIVKNFESREFVFDSLDNNWCAVCGAGIGITYLYAFPESFERVKDRIFGLMGKYLIGIGEDGFCFEGASYWQYGFGFFSLFFDVYTHLTGDYPEILNSQKVQNTLNFLTNTHLNGNKYLPYGDGGTENLTIYVDILSGMKNLFGDKFIEPACDVNDYLTTSASDKAVNTFRKGLGLRVINGINLFDKTRWKEELGCKYYKSAEIMVYRGENFAFTAKCGNNGESHSHNDVGTFEIVKNDKRLIADPGAGEYTWAYFNDYSQRYGDTIFVCGSQAHSVPIIDGKHQKEEKDFYGKVLSVTENSIKMDISTAYDKVINSITVEYSLNANGVGVVYEYEDNVAHQITYRFISDFEPKIISDKVIIDDLEIICENQLQPAISKKEYSIRNGLINTAYIVDYKSDRKLKDKVSFHFNVK